MSTFQEIFSTSSLEIVTPDTSIEFPGEKIDADVWLAQLRTPSAERNIAFFDEKLEYYLIIQFGHQEQSANPSAQLLAFLAHLQISFDATYISSVPVSATQDQPSRISTPPARTSSMLGQTPKSRYPPSIFPPATPHPIPSSADSDRRYVRSEGTPLSTGVWGDDPSESFQLLWSKSDSNWVAAYKLVLGVSFVRMNFNDPLLSLTVSVTLREKPSPLTGPRHRLAELIDVAGGIPFYPGTPITPLKNNTSDKNEGDEELTGLEEVNLLGGLSSAPTFRSEDLAMPSTRLGPTARHETFSLKPILPASPAFTPTPTNRTTIIPPTLRKSFRKTLKTVSGFRVRMRTVFVPYVLFPEYHVNGNHEHNSSENDSDSDHDSDEGDEWDQERKEAGNDESTVVLCVEVENSGESRMGFTVESVDVHISGDGSKTTLIQWGSQEPSVNEVFPLRIASMEQYNLLYAVTFLESPEADDSIGGTKKQGDMQRAVAININGKPHDIQEMDENRVVYPTRTFSSRWNCILDLSANINKNLVDPPNTAGNREALPTPASPFPSAGPATTRPTVIPDELKTSNIVSGSKRHTIGAITPTRPLKAPVNYRSSTSMLNPAFQKDRDPIQSSPLGFGAVGFVPPSISVQHSYPRTPTTYGQSAMSPPPVAPSFDEEVVYSPPPQTPAYPAYPKSPILPPTPFSQAPASSTKSSVGPSVEIRRGAGPRVFGGNDLHLDTADRGDGQPVVVSVGLLPLRKSKRGKGLRKGGEEMIYPNDKFTLDIFVFNQSSWMRRFELSYPDGRAWRKKLGAAAPGGKDTGIMPLENRIRVGPLRPSTCQSVRMDFLALSPGVHPVDTLMLTDIETGYAVNLRSVMDIVVHELPDA